MAEKMTRAQINAKLLPCPFCGGKAEVVTQQVCEDTVESWARCVTCFVQTDHYEAAYGNPLWALSTWNDRAPATTEQETPALGRIDG